MYICTDPVCLVCHVGPLISVKLPRRRALASARHAHQLHTYIHTYIHTEYTHTHMHIAFIVHYGRLPACMIHRPFSASGKMFALSDKPVSCRRAVYVQWVVSHQSAPHCISWLHCPATWTNSGHPSHLVELAGHTGHSDLSLFPTLKGRRHALHRRPDTCASILFAVVRLPFLECDSQVATNPMVDVHLRCMERHCPNVKHRQGLEV
ncbi:hypothetical protein LX32DRAFT_189396 [Colletotrichum zoysiae]|uniref:Uncharacterized protein n=1 Tax=Colletotrichum zoysiae TaxID=1216348 RepID=A0AAD9HNP0_9PEZI|nr:hypothetical protein LX32DRAFT_189396 [Colletotrichum zoysiae]